MPWRGVPSGLARPAERRGIVHFEHMFGASPAQVRRILSAYSVDFERMLRILSVHCVHKWDGSESKATEGRQVKTDAAAGDEGDDDGMEMEMMMAATRMTKARKMLLLASIYGGGGGGANATLLFSAITAAANAG